MTEAVESVPLTVQEGASGILGSISLVCWIFLLVPQLIENYRNGSAEAISLAFMLIWFVGDLTNLIGALWAHLVPVIIAIAVYFCIADGVLIGQCVYYNVKNSRKDRALSTGAESDVPDPTTPLLSRQMSDSLPHPGPNGRRRSSGSLRRTTSGGGGYHHANRVHDSLTKILEETEPRTTWIKNILSVLGICAIGAGGWAVAWQTGAWKPTPIKGPSEEGDIAVGAQVLGYFSAICYLGARIPQIIKNYREQSCEGLSLLFFIFSLMGNLTYGAGILSHSTEKDYFLTNLPWLIGSLGTMIEDITIFIQFRIYSAQDRLSNSAVI